MKMILMMGAVMVLAGCSPQAGYDQPKQDASASSNMGPGGPKNAASCSVYGHGTPNDDSRNAISPQADAYKAVDSMACEHP